MSLKEKAVETAVSSRLDQLERAYQSAQDEIRSLRADKDRLKRQLTASERQQEELLSMVPAFVPSVTITRTPKPSKATAVLVCSDWHYEERIDPAAIHGLNEHDRSICRRRIEALASKTIQQVEMFRAAHKIEKLVLFLGGDLISGAIHEELLETCEVPPAQAAYEVSELVSGVIETFLQRLNLARLEVLFVDGNHARSTRKPRVATRKGHSWEFLMGQMLASAYRKHAPMVTWHVADGEQLIHEVQGRKWRFTHGDTIKYQGGVGGLTIPANKAVMQWNKAVDCYHTVFGHWHQYIRTRHWTCNGSSVGYGAYSQHVKADYEPPQQCLIIADDDGIRQNTAIQLSKGAV